MNWINNQIVKLVLRHVISSAGALLVAKGILSDSDLTALAGALGVLLAIGHSVWDKRDIIIAEFQKIKTGTVVLMALLLLLPALLLTGCGTPHQIINYTKGTGLDLDLPLGYSGANVFEVRCKIGQFYSATGVNPVFTNGSPAVPAAAIASATDGSISAPSLMAAGGTNGSSAASISGGDKFTMSFGAATGAVTNTVGLAASTGK